MDKQKSWPGVTWGILCNSFLYWSAVVHFIIRSIFNVSTWRNITLYILINPCPIAAAISLGPFMSFSAGGTSRNLTRCIKEHPRGVAEFRLPWRQHTTLMEQFQVLRAIKGRLTTSYHGKQVSCRDLDRVINEKISCTVYKRVNYIRMIRRHLTTRLIIELEWSNYFVGS